MNNNRFVAENLVKKYNQRVVVDEVSISIQSHEIVGLLGPNGAGKTTTFYMMVGLIKPDTGQLLYNDHDITALPMPQRARQGISYLPQEASVFRKLTVEENLKAILQTLHLSPAEQENRLEELLTKFGLDRIRTNKAMTVSGGERRRVEIARALVLSPTFILLDEPFAGIDPIAVNDLQNIIRDLKNQQIGVLISDHNVRETLGICDRAYIMDQGKILEEGLPDTIVASPKARKIYLGDSFTL
ncbi:MAG: LPS export ABC transporter ATP-binding protein [Deltaproteobacteria bacterium]|nr:LPS export ABC transporter ATP-binding protein [Candidatus Anaeroferrophillus wilburensis]MBN2889458.1 LPS export ABC transporter ATP-binding protein [Deltaproteobacteria bacterium]